MIDKYFMMGWEVKGDIIGIDSFNGSLYLFTNMEDLGGVSYRVQFNLRLS